VALISRAIPCTGSGHKCNTNEGYVVSPDKATICGVIVTHHPDQEFHSRLQRLMSQVANVAVVDNGSSESCVKQIRELADQGDVHLILNQTNEGIARALNQGVEWAMDQGCNWVLTLDQDTCITGDFLQRLTSAYFEFPDRERLAVIGSNYVDPVRKTEFVSSNGQSQSSWKEVKTVITSGSLVSLSVFRTIGQFREELFIDCVDFEYCLRARDRGFRVILVPQATMSHPIGAVTLHKLPWKTTGTGNYPPIRWYYMTRNQLILAREFLWKEPGWTLSMLFRQFKSVILMCLFEKATGQKIKYIAMGLVDGVALNFGRKLT
jgi:rhamnosyltransferase